MSLLCRYCSSDVFGPVGWQKMWTSERSNRHLNLKFVRSCAELLHSADHLQCWFCRLISNKFRENEVDLDGLVAISEDVSCEVDIVLDSPRKSIPVTFCLVWVVLGIFYASNAKDRASMVPSPEQVEHSVSLIVGASTAPDNVAAARFPARAPIKGKFTNFDPSTAVEWLRCCSDNHPKCHNDPHSKLPKRVLDCSERSKSTGICLVETKEDHLAEYVALSYVWGGRQPFLTLSANIAEHMAEVDITTLPHTLQDAVHVTRAIGLRYLWIDALCIIQDSTKDKATEIGLMNQYYKNAFCVIAATMSKDATEGFLMTNVVDPLRFNLPPTDDITPQADFKHQVPFFGPDGQAVFLNLEANPPLYNAKEAPLNRRCWALQERLLCPRILRFTTPSSFSLQCNSAVECFAGHITYGPAIFNDYHRMIQPKGIEGATQKFNATSTDIHDSWLGLVARYAAIDISAPSDYLIAIAALAEEYHSRNPALGRYLAGHWAGHLQYSLDWIVFNPCHELRTYRAPSWSWASVEGGLSSVLFGMTKGEPQIEILECATSLAEVTLPFGAVTNGYLKIRARLEQVCWRRVGEHSASIYHITNQNVNKEEEEKVKTEPHEIGPAHPDTIENFPPPENDAATNETVFLMILSTYGFRDAKVFNLVLRKCRENTFRRVGFARRDFPCVSGMVEEKVFYLI